MDVMFFPSNRREKIYKNLEREGGGFNLAPKFQNVFLLKILQTRTNLERLIEFGHLQKILRLLVKI